MPKAYKKISVELYSENCTAFLKTAVMQNDANSRFLNVTLLMNGSKWEAPQGAIVTFQFKRPDGYNTSSWGTVEEDGTISVEIIDVMSQVGGEGLANIQIVTNEDDGQGGTNPSSLSSMPFIVQTSSPRYYRTRRFPLQYNLPPKTIITRNIKNERNLSKTKER